MGPFNMYFYVYSLLTIMNFQIQINSNGYMEQHSFFMVLASLGSSTIT